MRIHYNFFRKIGQIWIFRGHIQFFFGRSQKKQKKFCESELEKKRLSNFWESMITATNISQTNISGFWLLSCKYLNILFKGQHPWICWSCPKGYSCPCSPVQLTIYNSFINSFIHSWSPVQLTIYNSFIHSFIHSWSPVQLTTYNSFIHSFMIPCAAYNLQFIHSFIHSFMIPCAANNLKFIHSWSPVQRTIYNSFIHYPLYS